MSTFLSSVAVLLSTLALVCSGFAAYQVYTLRETQNLANTGSNIAIAPNSVDPSPAPASEVSASPSPEASVSPSPTATTQATATTAAIQPGEFVQPAFGTKGEVQLLSAKRIKDPDTGNSDVVNVQMRVRRKAADQVSATNLISVAQTTARDPDTSETYKAVGFERSTGSVSLFQLRPNASADAYVWLRVPEDVKTIDIFVPDTAGFKKVPISQ